MTHTQLDYFCAVCRYHSISRAAEELFISQPTISIAIKELEKEFNISLFVHGKNRITLTPDGELFYQKAQNLVNESESLHEEFSAIGKNSHPLRIGIPPMISIVFFPKLLNEFQKRHDIPVRLFEYGSLRACNMVDRGDLDAALVNMDFYDIASMNSFEILSDKLIFCVSKSHHLAKERSVTINMLKDEDIILLNTDSILNRTVYSRFRANKLTPKVRMFCSQLRTTLNFVEKGTCGAFLFSAIPVDAKEFVQIPLEPEMTSHFGLVWPKRPLQKDCSTFIDFIKESSKSIGDLMER